MLSCTSSAPPGSPAPTSPVPHPSRQAPEGFCSQQKHPARFPAQFPLGGQVGRCLRSSARSIHAATPLSVPFPALLRGGDQERLAPRSVATGFPVCPSHICFETLGSSCPCVPSCSGDRVSGVGVWRGCGAGGSSAEGSFALPNGAGLSAAPAGMWESGKGITRLNRKSARQPGHPSP